MSVGVLVTFYQSPSLPSAAFPTRLITFECEAAEHGIPWRRGYLFHGPPGSGKTSLVTALAGRLHKSISVVDLSSPYLNDGVRRVAACP